MYSRKSVRPRMDPWGTGYSSWIFLWRLPNQHHQKLPITEKRRNKVKYLTWNSIRPKPVKKTRMSNSVKSFWYIKCYSSSSSRPVKSPSNCIRHKRQKICSWSRRPKTMLEIREKKHVSLGDEQSYYFLIIP